MTRFQTKLFYTKNQKDLKLTRKEIQQMPLTQMLELFD